VGRLGKLALGWLLSAAVAGTGTLPAEHVHHSNDPDDHPVVIHRHLTAHHSPEATLDHDDEEPQWLDEPYVVARVAALVPSLALAGEAPQPDAVSPQTWSRTQPDAVPSIHDPPLTLAGLRAPPSSL